MAKLLPLLPTQKLHFFPAPITFLIAVAAVLSVFTAVIFLCGSHREDKKIHVRLGGKKKHAIRNIRCGLSSKALLIAKMISWRKLRNDHGGREEDEEEESGYGHDRDFEEEDGEDAVWRKTIIKGEKCRPLDFSGKILYDSNGNLLPN